MEKILTLTIIIIFISCQSKQDVELIEWQHKIDSLDNKFMESCHKSDSIEKLFLKSVENSDWINTEKLSKAYSDEVDNMDNVLDAKQNLNTNYK
jgi:hypothetical protein